MVIDSLMRIAILYEVTRSFCPNFAFHFIITNLLLLCLSQAESQLRYGRTECLYVKNDVYRIMVVSFAYFAVFSLILLFSSQYQIPLAFLISSYLFYTFIVAYD